MNEQQEREAFERWYEGHCLPGEADWFRRDPNEPDEYNHGHTSEAWAGWQARAELAANEKQPSRATDIATALSLPGCERLREWAEIGPVQRAAVEEFAYALAAKVPADPCLVLWKAMNQAERVGRRTDDKLIVKFLREAGYCIAATPAPAPEAEPCIYPACQTNGCRSACEAPAQAQHEAVCRYPDCNCEYSKGCKDGEMWRIAPAQAQQACEAHPEYLRGWKDGAAFDATTDAKPEAQQSAEPHPSAAMLADKSPGSEWHLTMMMAPHQLHAVVGQDREHLLAFARDVWKAAKAKPEAQPLTAMQARSVVDGMGWALDEVEIEDMEMLVKAAERACAEAWGVKLGDSGEASK